MVRCKENNNMPEIPSNIECDWIVPANRIWMRGKENTVEYIQYPLYKRYLNGC